MSAAKPVRTLPMEVWSVALKPLRRLIANLELTIPLS
jgi:hypothetical protein